MVALRWPFPVAALDELDFPADPVALDFVCPGEDWLVVRPGADPLACTPLFEPDVGAALELGVVTVPAGVRTVEPPPAVPVVGWALWPWPRFEVALEPVRGWARLDDAPVVAREPVVAAAPVDPRGPPPVRVAPATADAVVAEAPADDGAANPDCVIGGIDSTGDGDCPRSACPSGIEPDGSSPSPANTSPISQSMNRNASPLPSHASTRARTPVGSSRIGVPSGAG